MRQAQSNPGIESVAVADCYKDRREAAADTIKGKVYADFRELLDRKDIDGVIIATPDHWHVPIALMAAAAGKDAYVEKPLGLTIEQDLMCHKAFFGQDRIFQYGTQQREAKHQKIGRELILSGAIGDITAIEVQAPNGGAGGSSEPAPVPEYFDYDMWLGPAPSRSFNADRFFRFRKYWDYSGGIATDLFYHVMAPLNICWGEPQFPSKVMASGGVYGGAAFAEKREVPDTFHLIAEYAKGF